MPLPLAGGAPVQEQARARPISVAALGDVQAAILYAEAERVMEFLQVRPHPSVKLMPACCECHSPSQFDRAMMSDSGELCRNAAT